MWDAKQPGQTSTRLLCEIVCVSMCVCVCLCVYAVLTAASFACDNPTSTSVRVSGTAGLPQNAATLVIAFGNVDSSTILSAVLQGGAATCQYRATLAGTQNALQAVYDVTISSTASARFSGKCV